MERENWARTHRYVARRLHRPVTLGDLAHLLREGDEPVHALGTRHSFTDLSDTAGTLLDVTRIQGGVLIDDDASLASVPAGMSYGVLASALEKRGWALHNLASLPHISVAGATATGTHGSGDHNGSLSGGVAGLRFLDADGEERLIRRGDADFSAVAIGLGAFGVVITLDLELQPSYRVRQDIYRGLSWQSFLSDFDTVTGAGYSVSVFTTWDNDEVGEIWVKTRLVTDEDPVAESILDASLDRAHSKGSESGNRTVMGGQPGPWSLRLPHFRLDREPSYGAEIQSEYFVDRSDAVDALRAIRTLAPSFASHLVVSELRTVAREDELWLSPAYGRHTLAIQFTWHAEPLKVAQSRSRVRSSPRPVQRKASLGKGACVRRRQDC